MFVDLTEPERERFIRNTAGSYIPGYTGHCPSLKFRYGKRYGEDTRDILEDFRHLPASFPLQKQTISYSFLPGVKKDKDSETDYSNYTNLIQRPYILGYTGFIPGLFFEYGSSFTTTADKCIRDFNMKLAHQEKRRNEERAKFFSTIPQLTCIRGKDEVKNALEQYRHNSTCIVPNISPDHPPIAGYTGHIPGVRRNGFSVSQTFRAAALEGLTILNDSRLKRNYMNIAADQVRDAITYSHVH